MVCSCETSWWRGYLGLSLLFIAGCSLTISSPWDESYVVLVRDGRYRIVTNGPTGSQPESALFGDDTPFPISRWPQASQDVGLFARESERIGVRSLVMIIPYHEKDRETALNLQAMIEKHGALAGTSEAYTKWVP